MVSILLIENWIESGLLILASIYIYHLGRKFKKMREEINEYLEQVKTKKKEGVK